MTRSEYWDFVRLNAERREISIKESREDIKQYVYTGNLLIRKKGVKGQKINWKYMKENDVIDPTAEGAYKDHWAKE